MDGSSSVNQHAEGNVGSRFLYRTGRSSLNSPKRRSPPLVHLLKYSSTTYILTMAPRVVDPPFPAPLPPPLRHSCGYLLCSPWTRKNPLPLRSNLVPCQGRYSRRIESGRSARGVPLVRSPRRGVAAFITQPKYSPTFCASPSPPPW